MELENYKLEHTYRVYYANCCNYCFSSENLLKCSSCLSVYYCSKEHQSKDWAFHKPTCTALKEIKSIVPFPEDCDTKKFFFYKKDLLYELVKYRGFPNECFLTEYERQICLLPWVCSVCFKKPSSKYVCEKCLSVTYCSDSHQKSDMSHTTFICSSLRKCRIYSSVPYENGYKLGPITNTYHPIKKQMKRWPESKLELITHIQKNPKIFNSDEINIASYLLVDPYMPAATIIDALEMACLIKKRNFINNSICTKKKFDGEHNFSTKTGNKSINRRTARKHGQPRSKTTFKIHFAYADEYELSIQWKSVAEFLTNWITNIDDVEIVLIGPKLNDCKVPNYECGGKLARVIIHGELYNNVDFSTAPDLIVLLEFHRVLHFGDFEFPETLFKFENVPVILTSGDCPLLDLAFELIYTLRGVEIMADINLNDFTDMERHRTWEDVLSSYTRNNYYSVYRRICD